MRETNSKFRIPNSEFDLAGVLLHGRGATSQQMIALANRLDIDRVRWLAPSADGGSWYPNRFMEPIASNEPSLSRAIEACDQAVDAAANGGGVTPGSWCSSVSPKARVWRSSTRCGIPAAVEHSSCLTGGLIGPPGTAWPTVDLRGTRVLITGSDVDAWVPESRVRETARVLQHLGADVQLRIYTGRPHIVSDDDFAEARAFVTSCPRPGAVTAVETSP
jgi:phospholipase/carboxylesterase